MNNYGDLQLISRGRRHHAYRAKRQSDGLPVIIKALDDSSGLTGSAASIQYEYEVLRRLDLPGIARVLDLESLHGQPALILEDAGEVTLSDYLASTPLNVSSLLEFAISLAETLSGIHAANLIHRNLSPANIIVDPRTGRLTIVDFRIATSL